MQVKVIEIDSDRRRLSLSIKRVEGQQVEPLYKPVSDGDEGDEAAADVEAVDAEAPTSRADAEDVEAAESAEANADAEAEAAEEIEPVAVVDVEQSADEPAEAVETPDDTAVVLEDTPTLGLCDEVFPAGAERAPSQGRRGEADDAEADEAKADERDRRDQGRRLTLRGLR